MNKVSGSRKLLTALKTHALPQQDQTNSTIHQLSLRTLPIKTCNLDTPYKNGAYCDSNNLCDYSPTKSGTGCTSNYNAKAQCEQYGTPSQQNCSLNVCCLKFRLVPTSSVSILLTDHFACNFCESTSDFCDNGYQTGFGGCGPPPQPFCGDFRVGQRTVGSVGI